VELVELYEKRSCFRWAGQLQHILYLGVQVKKVKNGSILFLCLK